MKKLIILLFVSLPLIGFSQEKISEFTTTHANTSMGVVKMDVMFKLYNNKLVLNYLDKNTGTTTEKSGMEPVLTMPYVFSKESSEGSESYKYEDEKIQIMITLKENSKSSVSIKTKDNFSNKTTEQLYFSK
ncbi:hypothetical protein [uncultured Tenacibaculum sp.]|uniref:hypothetical protein n=1 Tax=uncultured Tenacibaculum sp. TaxID=174713 RepID=UPI002615413A|nr:hypothetical protein [uncultured Tenacibaculum sp.]